MPDLLEKFKAMQQQPDVKQSLQHSGDSYRDPRIRAVFAIAPAVARAFTPASLQKIAIPVEIVAGAADLIAPPADNAQFFAANIKDAQTHHPARRRRPLHISRRRRRRRQKADAPVFRG